MVEVGIEAVGVAFPDAYVDMAELAEVRGVAPGKYLEGIGVRQMAVPDAHEDTVTLAVRAAKEALHGVALDEVGLCVVGTETAVDHSKPVASFVQGLLGLPSHCRVYETKHACYGATAGLMTALDWIRAGSSRGRKALIIASDIARYGLGTAGEPTQGAGAVALLVSDTPKLVAMEPDVGTCSRDVMDFWRPLYSKDAVVDGPYSVSCYLDALRGAWAAHLAASGGARPLASDALAAICYHTPYPKMAKKAHEALRAMDGDPAPEASFARQVRASLALSSRIGNIYTGSLYVALVSVLATDERPLDGARVGFFSYGSGSCAELWTGRVAPGAQDRVRALDLVRRLDARRRLSVAEYEAIMRAREALDEKPLEPALGPAPRAEEGLAFLGVERDRRVYGRGSRAPS